MSDRIDTDAIRKTAIPGDPNAAAVHTLCDEVDALRSREVRLTEDEALIVDEARSTFARPAERAMSWPDFLAMRLVEIIDRLVPVEEP